MMRNDVACNDLTEVNIYLSKCFSGLILLQHLAPLYIIWLLHI